jgi:glc operon protein GlcG
MSHSAPGTPPLAAPAAPSALPPTRVFEEALAAGGVGPRILSMPNLTALEGGLPLSVRGEIVGAIGVSGMQSTHDAQVAQAGVDALARNAGLGACTPR